MPESRARDSSSASTPSRARPGAGTPPSRPPALVFDRDACLDLPAALAREWLETDGGAGYASLSSLFCPTRRQHGLLVTPYPGNERRHVFLQRFEETLHVGGRSFPLSMARYPGLYSPHGHQSLERFEAIPWPRSVHRLGDATIVREILMPSGPEAPARTVLVRYRVDGVPGPATLDLRPLLPCREADALTHENPALDPRVTIRPAGLSCRPYPELPRVVLTVAGAPWRFVAGPVWYRRVEYPVDLARGYEGHEDVFSPGTLSLALDGGGEVTIAVSTDSPGGAPERDPAALFDATARSRRAAWAASGDGVRGVLAYGVDRFLARAPLETKPDDGRPAVLAGFPWFLEWGRDAFLATPGLFFARAGDVRVEEGGDVLEGALRYLRGGLFPNRFATSPDASDYRSADAPLWFALAVRRYEQAGGSEERLRAVFAPALSSIVSAWERGTDVGREDGDGMPDVGSPASSLTWMDARVDGVPVTPRDGCPVEIAALWAFLRRYVADLDARFASADAARASRERADRSAATFVSRFRGGGSRALGDVWRGGALDATIRPNMVIAAALEWSPLPLDARRDVVRAAEAHLLTPRGLRTLAPSDPAYRPRYEGDVVSRDRAYHQGTVWPWLLGFHVEATLAAFGASRTVVTRLRALLDAFAPALGSFGLGHVAEVFDGDPPHRPGGTIAQAWSDAEILRAYALLDGRPAASRR